MFGSGGIIPRRRFNLATDAIAQGDLGEVAVRDADLSPALGGCAGVVNSPRHQVDFAGPAVDASAS